MNYKALFLGLLMVAGVANAATLLTDNFDAQNNTRWNYDGISAFTFNDGYMAINPSGGDNLAALCTISPISSSETVVISYHYLRTTGSSASAGHSMTFFRDLNHTFNGGGAGGAGNGLMMYHLGQNNGVEANLYEFTAGSFSQVDGTFSNFSITDNVWYNITHTYNDRTGVYRVYQDGVLIDTRLNDTHVNNNASWYFCLGVNNDEAWFNNLTISDVQAPAPDTNAPTFTAQQPANGFSTTGAVTISASWTDDVALASFIYETNITGSLANVTITASGASNFSNFTYPSLGVGAYGWRIYATDSSGNMNVTPARVFRIADGSAPISALQQPANGFSTTGAVTISAYWTDNVGLANFIFETNTSGVLANVTIGVSGLTNFSNFTYPALSVGAYRWRIYATDGAGNMESTALRTFSIAAVPVNNPNYAYISDEGVGFTGQVILKGMTQISAGTVDQFLNPANGNLELLALGLIIAAFGALIVGSASIGKVLKL